MPAMTYNMKIQFILRLKEWAGDTFVADEQTVSKFNALFNTHMNSKTFGLYLGYVCREFPGEISRSRKSGVQKFSYTVNNTAQKEPLVVGGGVQTSKSDRQKRDMRTKVFAVALKNIAVEGKWFSPSEIMGEFNQYSGHNPLKLNSIAQYCSALTVHIKDPSMKRRRRGRVFEYKYNSIKNTDQETENHPRSTVAADPNCANSEEGFSTCPSCYKKNISVASYCQWCGIPQGRKYPIELQSCEEAITVPHHVLAKSSVEVRSYVEDHVEFYLDYVTPHDVPSPDKVVFGVRIK